MEDATEWDERKRLANIEKHGIDFIECFSFFDAPYLRVKAKVGRDGEERWMGLGVIREDLVVAVIYCLRDGAIRLISVRRAHETERRYYETFLEG